MAGPTTADPILWGLIGGIVVGIIAGACILAGIEFSVAQPVAGGFFTGWLAGNLWNWSGRRRQR